MSPEGLWVLVIKKKITEQDTFFQLIGRFIKIKTLAPCISFTHCTALSAHLKHHLSWFAAQGGRKHMRISQAKIAVLPFFPPIKPEHLCGHVQKEKEKMSIFHTILIIKNMCKEHFSIFLFYLEHFWIFSIFWIFQYFQVLFSKPQSHHALSRNFCLETQ